MPLMVPDPPGPEGPTPGPDDPAPGGMHRATDGGDVPATGPNGPAEPSFRQLAESLADLVWSARPDGTIDFSNRRSLDYLGTPAVGRGGPGWAEALHPDDAGAARRAWEDALASGSAIEAEFRLRRHDGQYRRHRGRIAPIRDEAGCVARWLCICTDVDDRPADADGAGGRDRLLRSITDNATTAIFLMDAEGRTTFMNPAAEAMTGFTFAEAEGRVLHDLIHHHRPDGSPLPIGECPIGQHVLTQRELRGHEDAFVRKDGSLFPVRCAARPIVEDGSLTGIVLEVQDISEEKRAEEALRATEAQYQAVYDQAAVGIAEVDLDGRFLRANDRYCRIVGYPREELIGRRFRDITHPDDPPEHREKFARVADGPSSYTIEKRYVRKDGRVVWAHTAVSLIRGGPGRPDRVVAVVEDITERVRADEALRESEARLRRIVESDVIGLIVADFSGRLIEANDAFLRIVGYSKDDLRSGRLNFLDLTPPEYRHLDERAMAEMAAAGRHSPFEKQYVRKDGGRVPVLVGTTYLGRDGDGRELGVGFIVDLSERERAEAALRDSEERFRALMEQAPFSVQVFDPAGRTLAVNRAWQELWGLTPQQVADYNVLEDPQLEAKGVLSHLRLAFDGEPARLPAVEYDPNESIPGRTRHGDPRRRVSAVAYPLKDAEGRVREVVLVHDDITDRVRAEEALRRSEERLRLIVESATDYAIFAMDPAGRVSSWNSGARNLFGYEEAEILGRDGSIIFIPEDVERGVPGQEIRKALDRGRAENERWHVRKDGTLFWASGLLMPMREGGEVVGLLKIMRDTTEQKRTEQELEVSRERLDLVVNSSEVGLWYCDLPFDRLVWNSKCKEHFGLPPDAEVTIETFYERIHPDDREATRRAIERSVDGRCEYDTEFRTFDRRGGLRWVRAIGQPFYDADGTPLRFDGITVDVTQRIQQEEALREADRRKDEFLATLAHELRNPLAPIRTALHLMGRPDGRGGGHEAERAMAERQVVHLARLIDDLMDVARISKGKLELHTKALDLHTVVRQAVETARPQIDDRRHRLSVSLPDRPILLEADPTRLEQVFWNLLNNAAKYTKPGGRIDLAAEAGGGQVVVRVRDTGIGIAPEKLPHLFQMFVQLGEHREHAQGGLGIGLGLVRTLVELHGGTISAHSEGPGRGSEFVVRLPVLPPSAAGRDRPVREPAEGDGPELPRRRTLIVDDNADAANILAKLLGGVYGQEVRVAHDGPAGLEAAEAFRPEVVLLDIGLPGMDGHEVARRLRGAPWGAGPTLIALTGWGQESDRRRSQEAGFDHHLVKPVDPDDLVALLRTIAPAAD